MIKKKKTAKTKKSKNEIKRKSVKEVKPKKQVKPKKNTKPKTKSKVQLTKKKLAEPKKERKKRVKKVHPVSFANLFPSAHTFTTIIKEKLIEAEPDLKKLSPLELLEVADRMLAESEAKPVVLETTNYYFGESEEQAFLSFISSTEKNERDILYNKYLKKPFQKMVESILRRYPVHIGNYDIKEVEQNGLTHLIENMHKFKPDKIGKDGKKVKAFSYLQTIVRNYFRDHGKKSYAEKTSNLNYDDYSSDIENMEDFKYEIDHSEEVKLEEYMSTVIEKLREKLKIDKSLRRNEMIVGDAILNVLENWDVLFQEETRQGKYNKRITNNYTKNKILLFLKEQTRLSTKDIRASMKQFKELYYLNKQIFFNEEEDMNL